MDPFTLISAATSAIGLGISLFGGHKAANDSKMYANQERDVAQDEARQEQGINDLKQRQMELEGQRTQIENIRNAQRARAMGINAAVSQGAQYGSGLQGGIADTENQANFNMLGVSQGLLVGRGINQFNQNISSDRIQMASIRAASQSAQAQDQGLQSLGGALLKSGPLVGQFSKNIFGGPGIGTFSNGGNDGRPPVFS